MGFISISIAIFLFSYLGYKTRSKKLGEKHNPEIKMDQILTDLEDNRDTQQVQKNVQFSPKTEKNTQPRDSKINKSKFEVFRPTKDKSKQHYPKIIKSDISSETRKKK